MYLHVSKTRRILSLERYERVFKVHLKKKMIVRSYLHMYCTSEIQGWIRETTDEDGTVIRDIEFANDAISYLYNHFKDALTYIKVTCDLQWHDLLAYLIKFLSLSTTHYGKIWHHIFSFLRSKAWYDVLNLVKLLFTIPVTNVKLERMFLKLKHMKTNMVDQDILKFI